MKSTLYRRHSIWRRIGSNRAVRYVCFESLSEALFTVQSCDFHHRPVDREILRQHEDQAVELFIETDPQERNGSFPSLIEAIHAFDLDFEHDVEFTEAEAMSAHHPPATFGTSASEQDHGALPRA